MTNEDATIANIRAQLIAYGWTTINEEIVEKEYKPDYNTYLELIHEDGTRLGWGMFSRLYCWTETYEAITGKSWHDAIVRQDFPKP
jgi:hypothetical protein